ncbi:MAG: hypothetical protein ACKVLA_06555, partial [Rhodobacterales bacterium]
VYEGRILFFMSSGSEPYRQHSLSAPESLKKAICPLDFRSSQRTNTMVRPTTKEIVRTSVGGQVKSAPSRLMANSLTTRCPARDFYHKLMHGPF